MKAETVFRGEPRSRHFVLGNEAIVRGALEGGLQFAASYPGTPSSEIGDVLYAIAEEASVYFEFSINEKVAMEVAASAAAAGRRSMTFMKHVGLNVAADPFMTAVYTGTEGGFAVIVADDPSMHSSQNEQDTRHFARLSRCPMLEPSDTVEAYQMMKAVFSLSEALKLPFLVRTTTRVAHTRSVVQFGPIPQEAPESAGFVKDPVRWVPIPAYARIMHAQLWKKLEKAAEMSENSPFNFVTERNAGGKKGIVTSGCAFNYVMDSTADADVRILKLGMTYPVPEKKIADFLRGCDEVMVIEELEPYLEEAVRLIAQQEKIPVRIIGKLDGLFSVMYEYTPDLVRAALRPWLGLREPAPALEAGEIALPPRPPVLCPGCAHRSIYYAARTALRKSRISDAIFSSDIGCYTLGIMPPAACADYLLCMGSSTGAGAGLSRASGRKTVSFIGDSTFFHSGLSGLINAYHNNHNLVLVVMDNSTTAMTGHQPHPGIGGRLGGVDARKVSIEALVRAIGIEFVKKTDGYDTAAMIEAFQQAFAEPGVSVIIAEKECALASSRKRRKSGELKVYQINQDCCVRCYACIKQFACPAFYREEGKVYINPSSCDGCGVCAQVCPKKCIEVKNHE